MFKMKVKVFKLSSFGYQDDLNFLQQPSPSAETPQSNHFLNDVILAHDCGGIFGWFLFTALLQFLVVCKHLFVDDSFRFYLQHLSDLYVLDSVISLRTPPSDLGLNFLWHPLLGRTGTERVSLVDNISLPFNGTDLKWLGNGFITFFHIDNSHFA